MRVFIFTRGARSISDLYGRPVEVAGISPNTETIKIKNKNMPAIAVKPDSIYNITVGK